MSEKIFIGVAWPYATGPLHLGHVAGAYLPADIFARYHRAKGNEVLMVSGSDQHGTPITIKAEKEGKTPAELVESYHQQFLKNWQNLGISFDLFTRTETANHAEVAQDIFRTLKKNGYIYKDTASQPYCPQDKRFLPDRYIEGVCPNCHTPGARGDQCDFCGKPLNPSELTNAKCRICGAAPEFRDTEHFFFKLSAFQDKLSEWVSKQSHWRPNVANLTRRYLNEGLRDRAITRDLEWGIPVPEPGFEGKCLYVWFEAVIGYLSATKEWAKSQGDDTKWRRFWQGDVKTYYFIGKDNIPFHTLIWPGILMGYDTTLNLPFDVPANEFLTIEGKKLSTSRNWAVWLPDFLSRYDPDPLRYLLSINMPETGDTDFSWREFVRRNNDELVATYGNLVNRVMTFVYRNFNGCVPTYEDMGVTDINAFQQNRTQVELNAVATLNERMDREIAACHFKNAARMAMDIAQEANRFLDEKAPWKTIKLDRQAAANSLYTALRVIAQMKTMLYPFLPFSSQKVHEYLGFSGKVEDYGWKWQELPPGQKMLEPKPLFIKLDDNIIEEEAKRIGT
jgi:methionyl-tRNA synthetase